jgi:hypothetical protein
VRAGRRADDRLRPAHEPELVVAPVRSLGPVVLAVPDVDRPALERLLRRRGVEVELDISQSPSCLLLKSLKT